MLVHISDPALWLPALLATTRIAAAAMLSHLMLTTRCLLGVLHRSVLGHTAGILGVPAVAV